MVLVVPLFERQAAGIYRNSAAIIDADGELLGVYRKMHIPDDPLYYEKYYFTPGDALPLRGNAVRSHEGFAVWTTRYADIGVLICWDQWYPEGARITSLLGRPSAVYLLPSGGTRRRKRPRRRAARGVQTCARARDCQRRVCRIANRVASRTSRDGGIEFSGTRSSPIRSVE